MVKLQEQQSTNGLTLLNYLDNNIFDFDFVVSDGGDYENDKCVYFACDSPFGSKATYFVAIKDKVHENFDTIQDAIKLLNSYGYTI